MDIKNQGSSHRITYHVSGNSKKVKPLLAAIAFTAFFIYSCNEDGLKPASNNVVMHTSLSDYNIYEGDETELIPAADFHLYELATELFTDYAEKQRLIKIPAGSVMAANTAGGLPDFPEGTILVKTFYYYNDRRDPAKGKRIIETRLEIKSDSKWNVATYLWNAEQTDAVLVTTGFNTTVNWIDQQGKGRVISYHVPSNRECAACHNSNDVIIPIGPKLTNLNTMVTRNATAVNQLTYLYNLGILDAADPHATPALPAWSDASYTLAERGRAYLDVNCAHCHKSGGIGKDAALFFDYDKPFHDTGINSKKKAIVDKMKSGQMPRIGTSIVHDEGLDLIRQYIDSL